jgi:hypothetical protein
VAKMNKTSKKRSDDDDDLDDMRESFKRHKERSSGGGGGGKNDWDKLGDGKNMRRVLPRPGEKKFYTEGWTHFNVGPNNRALRCIDEDHINQERGLPESGTKCPLCKKFLREQSRINSEFQKGDEDGQAEWKRAKDKYVPRHQFYSNVLVADDDGDVEVKILAFGTQIWGALMNYYLGDDTAIGDFTDPKSGRWVNIKKVHKGGRDRRNIGYEVFPKGDSEDISDAWDDIKDAMHDLDAAAGKLMSKDEVLAIMKGVDLDKGSDDGDDDDDDDDDSDDTSSSRKKTRGSDDDDDEDEEEEDDDTDDDDDKPVKTKKSKLAVKMKKRRDD